MKGSAIRSLILKDWRLHRIHILLSTVCGVAALAVLLVGGETATVLGSVWFFIALIVLGSMLPISNIVNERKKQNLPFVMSLPVSSLQYTWAKLISTVGMFLLPWLTLMAAALWLIAGRGILPHGTIPLTLILANLTFIGFSVIAGASLVGETEGWAIAGSIVCNSTYGLSWYFMTRVPAIVANLQSPTAVWNSTTLTILGSEFALMALILGLTVYVQTRKRDFI